MLASVQMLLALPATSDAHVVLGQVDEEYVQQEDGAVLGVESSTLEVEIDPRSEAEEGAAIGASTDRSAACSTTTSVQIQTATAHQPQRPVLFSSDIDLSVCALLV